MNDLNEQSQKRYNKNYEELNSSQQFVVLIDLDRE